MVRRADAVRNSEAVLEAAEQLFAAAQGWQNVTVDAVAARAGAGKGTVFRAFGDRAGLLRAVMAHRSAALRDAVTHGPQPLGPGAAPAHHVLAVLDALLEFKLRNRPLSSALDDAGSGSPYAGEWYGWWHAAISRDLEEISSVTDPEFAAHALLAAVRSDLVEHLLVDLGWNESDLRHRVHDHATSLLG